MARLGDYNIRRIIFAILAVTWMVVIFSFSARPGEESENQSIKAGMAVCHVFVPGFDNMSEEQQIHMSQTIDYQVLLFSMQSLGYRCLYGLFLIPALFFGLAGNLVIAVVPAVRFAVVGMARLWWSLYKLLHHTIYGISRIAEVNINKYAEYRCDTYAVRYGCGEGLLSFLRRLEVAETGGERPSFTEYIMSTHPSTEKRIVRLEKLL